MTIASELTKLNTNMQNAYTACDNKGATMPQAENMDNLATCISSIPTGSSPVISSLTVTPTTSQQTITAPSGTDGYSPITVSAVTSSIDSNITAANIVSGVSILGVSGSAVKLNATTTSVTPTTSSQTVTPSSPYNGFSSVSISAVTSSIDSNITAGNIKKDVSILGVTGTYEGSGDIGIPREVSAQGVYQYPTTNFTFSLPSNVTNIGRYALYYVFYNCTTLVEVNLSNITTVSNYGLQGTFSYCSKLTSVNLSALTTISGNSSLDNAFSYCSKLTSISLPTLTTISGTSGLNNTFTRCSNLTSVNLSALTTISGNYGLQGTFSYCSKLTSVNLSALTTISGNSSLKGTFSYCSKLTDIYFNSLRTTSFGFYTNQFENMLSNTGTSVTHTVHFPSNLQSTISGLSGYPNFGGTSGYVTLAFDLPATS